MGLDQLPKVIDTITPAGVDQSSELDPTSPVVLRQCRCLQARDPFTRPERLVLDPDRRVDEDHADVVCRRGTGFASGSLPASCASRFALSRSINARRA